MMLCSHNKERHSTSGEDHFDVCYCAISCVNSFQCCEKRSRFRFLCANSLTSGKEKRAIHYHAFGAIPCQRKPSISGLSIRNRCGMRRTVPRAGGWVTVYYCKVITFPRRLPRRFGCNFHRHRGGHTHTHNRSESCFASSCVNQLRPFCTGGPVVVDDDDRR